ncbi:MAG: serine hydrolase family protein [Actinobacteria bacterium]|nr:MAG: serine hydrolase family protein [Actinomycetota bacterium]
MPPSINGAEHAAPVLVVPGWRDSGAEHWQSVWLRGDPGFRKLVQDDWENPRLDEWCRALASAISSFGQQPPVLVAHSLGCALVAHWARLTGESAGQAVAGALLVAPADADSPDHTPDELRPFAPIPTAPLPFPSILVASRNDPYISFQRCLSLARAWGSEFVDAGAAGHINVDSGHGQWPQGEVLLASLRARPS